LFVISQMHDYLAVTIASALQTVYGKSRRNFAPAICKVSLRLQMIAVK